MRSERRAWRIGLFAVALLVAGSSARADSGGPRAPTRLNEMTIAQMQTEMAAGRLSSEELTRYYLTRIALLDQGPLGVTR